MFIVTVVYLYCFLYVYDYCLSCLHFLLLQINQTDNNGWCPLVYAAYSGQLDAVSFLLQWDWSVWRDRRPMRNEALQQALVAACTAGHEKVSHIRLTTTILLQLYF